MNLWKQLVEDETTDYYIIIEDDVTLADNFSEKLNYMLKVRKNPLILYRFIDLIIIFIRTYLVEVS